MIVSGVTRKHEKTVVHDRLVGDEPESRSTDRVDPRARLGPRKSDTTRLRVNLVVPKRQRLHSPEAGQQHELHRRDRDRAFVYGLPHHVAECGDLMRQEPPFTLVAIDNLPRAKGRVALDHLPPRRLLKNRMEHTQRPTSNARATCGDTTTPVPSLRCFPSGDVRLEILKVG